MVKYFSKKKKINNIT